MRMASGMFEDGLAWMLLTCPKPYNVAAYVAEVCGGALWTLCVIAIRQAGMTSQVTIKHGEDSTSI